MDCAQVTEHLPEYLSGTLDAPARLAMETHRESCPRCRAEIHELAALWSDLETVRTEASPAGARVRFDAMLQAFEEGRAANDPPVGRRSPQRLGQVAAALLLTLAGAITGYTLRSPEPGAVNGNLASLEEEVRALQQLVALSLLDQRSASQRLQGVGWSSRIDQPNEEVLSTLIDTMNHDPNVNVRLAAVGVLGQFADTAIVREGMVRSLPVQQSPMIQLALIDLLVQLHDPRSPEIFERLAADEMADATVRERAAWALEQLG